MKKYISLMKLRVVELLLVTTLPALFLASEGVPDLSITFWSLLGGTFAAGGANAYNMIIEAKSDLLMKRTANRPIATGEISRNNGLLFATLISLISLTIFYIFTTPLATLLTFLAITFYVFGYTIALKKHTSQNIVWGGIAGCMPVLIGQAAVTNSLTATSWLFFLLIFFWTPPHFWALAVRYKDDYKAAGIPMLPVVAPIKSVINQMWFHSLAMVLVSLLVIFYIFTTELATVLTALAIIFYIFGYTIALKRHTSQNIVWGGIAGCMPVLIGQAAVTNSLTATSWLFFLLIFFWTPPHFWALAVRYKDDYAAAGIPMLPVVAPIRSVITQMWFHSLAMVIVSLLVIRSAGLSNWLFVITLLLIVGWKRQLIKLTKQPSEVNAGKLFQASIIFLSIYSFLLVLGVLLK